MPSTRYYYANASNQPVGPFLLTDLQTLLNRDILSPDTQVCQEDGSEWLALSSLLPPASGAMPRSVQASERTAAKKKQRSFIDTSFEGNVVRPMKSLFVWLAAIALAILASATLFTIFDIDPEELRGNRAKGIVIGLTVVIYGLLRVGHSFVKGFREESSADEDHEG